MGGRIQGSLRLRRIRTRFLTKYHLLSRNRKRTAFLAVSPISKRQSIKKRRIDRLGSSAKWFSTGSRNGSPTFKINFCIWGYFSFPHIRRLFNTSSTKSGLLKMATASLTWGVFVVRAERLQSISRPCNSFKVWKPPLPKNYLHNQ